LILRSSTAAPSPAARLSHGAVNKLEAASRGDDLE
jgi:hypothetical protein